MNSLAADLHSPFTPSDLPEALRWPSPTFTELEFCNWLAAAAPGKRIEYYRGHLAVDRMPSTSRLPSPRRIALVAVAKRALQAAEDGQVHLVQRRHGDGDYSYFAIKAKPVSARRGA